MVWSVEGGAKTYYYITIKYLRNSISSDNNVTLNRLNDDDGDDQDVNKVTSKTMVG